MKISILLLSLFLLNTAYSAGYGGANGENRLGETVSISPEDLQEIWVNNKRPGHEELKRFKIADECPAILEWLDVEISQSQSPIIECSKDGQSPLAGTTYTKLRSSRIKNVCGANAILFKCIKGCEKKSVPLTIVEQPWEC